jgi:hypothetical protein
MMFVVCVWWCGGEKKKKINVGSTDQNPIANFEE